MQAGAIRDEQDETRSKVNIENGSRLFEPEAGTHPHQDGPQGTVGSQDDLGIGFVHEYRLPYASPMRLSETVIEYRK